MLLFLYSQILCIYILYNLWNLFDKLNLKYLILQSTIKVSTQIDLRKKSER